MNGGGAFRPVAELAQLYALAGVDTIKSWTVATNTCYH